MRARTNIKLKERSTLEMGNFKGVDFSSSALTVRRDRASNARNFINEYGVNKKRNGWNELFKIRKNGKAQRINGVFKYTDGDYNVLIIHAGNGFYRAVKEKNEYIVQDITNSSTYTEGRKPSEILDQRSQVFYNKGRMYIVGCGDFLVYGTWNNGESYELRCVADDEDTYIPTTTISIDNDSITDDTQRAMLDEVNLLSSRRKNSLVGTSETGKSWTLDTSIDENSKIEVTIETIDSEGEPVTKTLVNMHGNYGWENDLYDGVYAVGHFENKKKADGNQHGVITLDIATTPQIENLDNIVVKFYHSTEILLGKNASIPSHQRITNCQFGVVFGVNGNTNRLFVSGNKNFKNLDFYSEEADYTYFPDLNYSTLGSDNLAINGYTRLSDSTLLIFKEEGNEEATIFYRSGELNEENGTAYFPTYAGSVGESIVSRYACGNLAGDNLILSRNGVFGVTLSDNVATTERYTRERSRSVNGRLVKHEELSNAVGVVFKNRYYLALDEAVYIADSRYKYTTEDDIDGSYNYEWWYWDNVPVRVWASIDNELYFGSNDGMVCVFDNEYTDRTYSSSSPGDLGLDISNNKISYSENLDIDLTENDKITVKTEGLYSLLSDSVEVENGRIVSTAEKIAIIHDFVEVYADNVGESGLSVNTPYYIRNIDNGELTYSLADTDGNIIELARGGFRLYEYISGEELYLTGITSNSFQVKRYKEGDTLLLASYNGTTPTLIVADFTHIQNVVAEWYTPIFDLGTNESSKTLLKMTISTEPEVNGRLSFGYETRDVERLINAKGITIFSLDNFSFENFSFDTGFANSYSVKCNDRNFNFIIFRFISDNDSNCVVNNFTIIYKINKSNKGVR